MTNADYGFVHEHEVKTKRTPEPGEPTWAFIHQADVWPYKW